MPLVAARARAAKAANARKVRRFTPYLTPRDSANRNYSALVSIYVIDRMETPMKIGVLLAASAMLVAAAGPELERARKLYHLTDFDQSLKVLEAAPQKDAEIYELIGRNHYM